jgi:hypothetical protein
MTETAAIAIGCMVLALAAVLGALRCLADHLLTSAAIYTLLAIALVGEAATHAIDSL